MHRLVKITSQPAVVAGFRACLEAARGDGEDAGMLPIGGGDLTAAGHDSGSNGIYIHGYHCMGGTAATGLVRQLGCGCV